jgi:ABC-type multidrug transport system permease subunit
MIFAREASSRIYSPEVFALSQLIGEMPYSTLCAIVYWVLLVYPQHFGQGSAGLNGTGFQLLVILFTEFFGVTLGQLIAALTPSVQVAVLFNPFVMVVLSTFCGVTIPYPSLISFWRSWLYELNPLTRVLGATLATELQCVLTSSPHNVAFLTLRPQQWPCNHLQGKRVRNLLATSGSDVRAMGRRLRQRNERLPRQPE